MPSPHPRPSRPSGYNPVELSRFAVGALPLVFQSPARLTLWVFGDPDSSNSLPHPVSPSRPSSLSRSRRPDLAGFSGSAQGIPAPPLTTVILRTRW